MSALFDSAALGSDVPRTFAQGWRRLAGRAVASAFNRPGALRTEILQALDPVHEVVGTRGSFLCRGGHGRLAWRAETFLTEEPETVRWLDGMSGTLWDVGANVGMYSIYAAKCCNATQVVAFEPESQNYALLVDNINLNDLASKVLPANIALCGWPGMRRLNVRYLTKGGAYNGLQDSATRSAAQAYEHHAGFEQLVYGCTIDELCMNQPPPDYLKIDVDGVESSIIVGAMETIRAVVIKSILVELNERSEADMSVPAELAKHGYRVVSKASNWTNRADKTQAEALPAFNYIFER